VLIEAEETGDRLTHRELIMLMVQLIFAGHETTQTLLSTGMWRLLQRPDQLALLRERPDLIPNAVDEMLRLDPPALVVARIPRVTFPLGGADLSDDRGDDRGGVELTEGDYVMLSLFSANHDPALYDDPDSLDVTRTVDRQFAFGFGAHFCVGNHLARTEAAAAFEVLLRRFSRVEESGTSRWAADTLRGRRDVTIQATP
jgi:cytochrome P450